MKEKEKRYAILIASSRFPNEPDLDDLRFPENDVDALEKVLKSPKRGAFTETFVLKDAPSYEIQTKIHQVLNDAGKNDLVLIYYAGHGKLNRLGRLCLTASNTMLNLLETTSLPMESLKSLMDIASTQKKILLLDCCYSGAAGDIFSRGTVDDQLQVISRGRGTYIITASTKTETALEKEDHGVFTRHLVEGIKTGEADRDVDGLITIDELYEYVHEQVCLEGCQEPMKWDLSVKGRLVIAKSGKKPNVERRNQIRKMLLDFAHQDILPDSIFAKAIDINRLGKSEIKPLHGPYIRLLDDLLNKQIKVGDFILRWSQLVSAPDEDPIPDIQVISSETEKADAADGDPEAEITVSFGLNFVWIRPGKFMMGSPEDEPGRSGDEALHEVILTRGFYMQTTPVTQRQYEAVMGNNPSRFKESGPDAPVEKVSWRDAQDFIRKLNQQEGKEVYRLPTEAEWEYACRAGTDTPFFFGRCLSTDEANYDGNHPLAGCPKGKYREKTTTVKSFPPNAWGLYDMHGNVWEWCQDWYDSNYYGNSPKEDPQGPDTGGGRVFRGGSWYDFAVGCRSAVRGRYTPAYRVFDVGFRLLRSLP